MDADAIASLIEGSPGLREALSVVLERTEQGEQTLAWEDVKDTLSSGQWGRLIETGMLASRDDEFALVAPAAASTALADDGGRDADGPSLDTSWSTLDKMAGIVALGLFLSYSVADFKHVVVSIDRLLLEPLDAALPFFVVILLLAVVTGFYSTVLQGLLIDRDLIETYQSRVKDVQEQLSAAREADDEDAIERLEAEQQAAMGDQASLMKHQFRPMVWIVLLTIPAFLWMRWKVNGGHLAPSDLAVVMPLAGRVSLSGSLVGPFSAWLAWYFVCSMAFRQVVQKALPFAGT